MNISGKVWGATEVIVSAPTYSVHRLKIVRGGFSSIHSHQRKSNLFYVLAGAVLIRIYPDASSRKSSDETILRPGQSIEIEPGKVHSFMAIEDSEAIEIYDARLSEPDILRETTGGVATEAEVRAVTVKGD